MLSYAVSTDEQGDVTYAGMDEFTEYYSEMFGTLFMKKYSPTGTEIFNVTVDGKEV
jgi:hypothetical protein